MGAGEGMVGEGADATDIAGGSGLSLLGHHQRANAALACALLQAAARRGLPVAPDHLREGLRTARWPGRLEPIARRPLVLVDGAHNPHAARALVRALPGIVGARPVQLVFAAMADKEHAGMLRELLPLTAGLHFCPLQTPRGAEPEILADAARLGREKSVLYRGAAEALAGARAAAGERGVVLCCGSLYLVGEVSAAARGRSPARMPSERM